MIAFLFASLLHSQAPGDSLTLGDALLLAHVHRGQVRASAAGAAAARASLRVAGSLPNPVASYSYTDDPPRQHASLEQSFDWLLTRGADRAVASSGLERALADSAQQAAELSAEVRSAFYGAMAGEELERVTLAQQEVADSLLVVAGRRLASGDIAEVERDQLRLEAFRAGQRLSRAREAARIARARLERTVGDGTRTARPLAGTLGDGVDSIDRPPSRTAPAASGTPMLRAAVADSIAAAERVRRAAAGRVPLPSLTAGADWDDPGGRRGALAVFGISIPLPLWQHGAGALALAQAEAARAAATTAEARLELSQQFSAAGASLEESRGRARVARDSLLPVARRLRERATMAYGAGETGVIPLLEALRAERDVTAEAVDDLLSFQEAWAAWKRVLGEAE